MTSEDLRKLVLKALEDSKAKDIVELNVSKLTTITDIMFFCSGTSTRQVKSIANNVIKAVKEHHFKVYGLEGENEGEWVLVDFSDIIVHVMLPTTREFYQLEKLWDIEPPQQTAI